MIIQRNNPTIQPLQIRPEHNLDKYKTPTLQKVEREMNITNHKVSKIAKDAADKVYEMFQKVVQNTDYNVSYSLGKFGEEKQFRFSLKSTGKEIISLPPDAAVNIAERAKHTSIGLLMDERV